MRICDSRTLIARWLKFNAVGLMGVGVQLAMLVVLASGLRIDYLPATALAVETAILHNFLWHERYTWADRTQIAAGGWLRRLVCLWLVIAHASITKHLQENT